MYLDELYELKQVIKKRKLTEYRMQFAIARNAQAEKPEAFLRALDEADDMPQSDDMDRTGLENLKQLIAKGSAIKVK